ncbi:alpha/beta hydrolase [Bermanella marisrubri]|uniref:Putative lipase/esterase n=1 Tax=Bermanella marisrubri TaxID=207949 RepID=Q1N6R7_9GAMM|nr:alpha/beta hydrolase [Bermanella marisrubri]EAT13525.1 putative lipase/esterase [Oceanobacter sp. RED65] [Bermanella marisrubri]QIZ84325.1 alpha/beta hydrolase [Bermanella marisrubri]
MNNAQNTKAEHTELEKRMDEQQLFACKFAKWTPSLHYLPVWMSRQNYELLDTLFGLKRTGIKKDTTIQTIDHWVESSTSVKRFKIRCYYPHTKINESKTPTDALMFFHGGGCAIGSLKSHDAFCRFLSKQTKSCVIAVDYGLGPKHPYPTAIINAIEATNYVHQNAKTLNINPDTMGASGDSAGAYLSLLCNQTELTKILSVDIQYSLKYLALLYPMLDLTGASESYKEHRPYQILTPDVMQYFARHYLQDMSKAQDELASPVLAKSLNLDIPCFTMTAEFDPLRDDGFRLATRYGKDLCEHIHADDSTHGFIHLAGHSKKALAHCQRFAEAIIKLKDSL